MCAGAFSAKFITLESFKVCREFRVTSQNLLSSRYILCTTDLSSNVEKELHKVLAFNILQRTFR